MKSYIRVLAVVCLVGFAVGADPAGDEVSDKDKTFSVKVPAEWTRDPAMEAKNPKMSLIVRAKKYDAGKVVPMLKVFTLPGDVPVNEVVKSLVESAKSTEPDQGDAGQVKDFTLDGESGQMAVVKTANGKAKAQTRYVLAKHKGKVYVVSFSCDRADYAKRSTDADALIDSFKWK